MGRIVISIEGSFAQANIKPKARIYSALNHGHADAVARAIEFLSGYVLPRATALDHKLHADGKEPDASFERKGGVGFEI